MKKKMKQMIPKVQIPSVAIQIPSVASMQFCVYSARKIKLVHRKNLRYNLAVCDGIC